MTLLHVSDFGVKLLESVYSRMCAKCSTDICCISLISLTNGFYPFPVSSHEMCAINRISGLCLIIMFVLKVVASFSVQFTMEFIHVDTVSEHVHVTMNYKNKNHHGPLTCIVHRGAGQM